MQYTLVAFCGLWRIIGTGTARAQDCDLFLRDAESLWKEMDMALVMNLAALKLCCKEVADPPSTGAPAAQAPGKVPALCAVAQSC